MEHCNLQIGCLVIVLYIALNYYRERRRLAKKRKLTRFSGLLLLSVVSLVFDGLTAYFVNNRDQISEGLNKFFHACYLLSLDAFIFLLFLYLLVRTEDIHRRKFRLLPYWIPFAINVVLVVANIDSLEYKSGEISDYSWGMSAYTCFIMVGIYILLSIITFFRHWHSIESHKRVSIFTYLMVLTAVAAVKIIFPQMLITSIAVTVIILGIYLNQENPAIKRLANYHSEMVTNFATLVENRDAGTGGHIRRTSIYVKLLAEELKKRGIYKNVLTRDYINELEMAAPLHDIGKISVPDHILCKPGKLTDEEYEIMKSHTVSGGKIIHDTFGKAEKSMYGDMAYQVAMYHHEKWNGKGYPEGKKRDEIPLCARIMAVADVFDAVSQNRCYREAMPLDRCFEIIANGSGKDFEPILADVFLDMREEIELVHHQINDVNPENTDGKS